MTKWLVGRKNDLKGRMRPAGLTLAMSGILFLVAGTKIQRVVDVRRYDVRCFGFTLLLSFLLYPNFDTCYKKMTNIKELVTEINYFFLK